MPPRERDDTRTAGSEQGLHEPPSLLPPFTRASLLTRPARIRTRARMPARSLARARARMHARMHARVTCEQDWKRADMQFLDPTDPDLQDEDEEDGDDSADMQRQPVPQGLPQAPGDAAAAHARGGKADLDPPIPRYLCS